MQPKGEGTPSLIQCVLRACVWRRISNHTVNRSNFQLIGILTSGPSRRARSSWSGAWHWGTVAVMPWPTGSRRLFNFNFNFNVPFVHNVWFRRVVSVPVVFHTLDHSHTRLKTGVKTTLHLQTVVGGTAHSLIMASSGQVHGLAMVGVVNCRNRNGQVLCVATSFALCRLTRPAAVSPHCHSSPFVHQRICAECAVKLIDGGAGSDTWGLALLSQPSAPPLHLVSLRAGNTTMTRAL
jgi:hypothetical protein